MLKVKNDNIWITRGDSGLIRVDVTDKEDKPIDLPEGSKVRIQVREAPDGGSLLFEGDVYAEDDHYIWHVHPEDTEGHPSATYVYDAQVEYPDGDVFTFIELHKFTTVPESTEKEA